MAIQKVNPSGKTMGQINKEVASKGKAPVVKVNSNPNPTPAKSMKGPTDSSIMGNGPQKYDWGHNEWNSKEGTDDYGNPTYNPKAPIQPIKVHSSTGVLGGTHMGGHSDVSTAINLGGFTVKTPIVKPSSTKNK